MAAVDSDAGAAVGISSSSSTSMAESWVLFRGGVGSMPSFIEDPDPWCKGDDAMGEVDPALGEDEVEDSVEVELELEVETTPVMAFCELIAAAAAVAEDEAADEEGAAMRTLFGGGVKPWCSSN